MKFKHLRNEEFFEADNGLMYVRVTNEDVESRWYQYIFDAYEPACYIGLDQNFEEKLEAEHRMQVKELSKVLEIII